MISVVSVMPEIGRRRDHRDRPRRYRGEQERDPNVRSSDIAEIIVGLAVSASTAKRKYRNERGRHGGRPGRDSSDRDVAVRSARGSPRLRPA
jgi:hypothetical protein